MTIAMLLQKMKTQLGDAFRNIYVVGEISEAKQHTSGHVYMKFKEGSNATLKGVVWSSTRLRMKGNFLPGMTVIIRGSIDVYAPSGEFNIIIDHMEQVGLGQADMALKQLKEKLLKKGYFSQERKRPIPLFPRRIGIITSATGAAIRDMLELFVQRWPYADLIIRASRVQGEGAALEINRAIHHLNHLHKQNKLPLDIIFVGRGGGSKDDLGAFNEEIVADAIFQSVVPVVTAVGHETDITVADYVADMHAETPSAAVNKCVPDKNEVLASFRAIQQQLLDATLDIIHTGKNRVDRIADRPVFRKPLDRILEKIRRLGELNHRLVVQGRLPIEKAKQKVLSTADRLESLSPLKVLSRGYSLTFSGENILRDAESVKPGDEIRTKLHKGEVVSIVTDKR